MEFNKHTNLAGQHAFLSASKPYWIRYDDEKLDNVFITSMAAKKGTELHALAHELIRLGVKLPSSKKTLNLYVNECIGYRMIPEQILYYSENSFGTADAISFRKNMLRISDLKTGLIEKTVEQLEIYAALFCLEYLRFLKLTPFDIQIELRIYQSDEVRIFEADPEVIVHIMDKIISFDKRITALKTELM